MRPIRLACLLACLTAQVMMTTFAWCDVVETIGTLAPATKKGDKAHVELMQSASRLILDGDVIVAYELLKSLENDPDVSDIDVVMADLLFAAGRKAEGLRWLEQATAKSPRRVALYLAFSELAIRQQRWFDGWNLSRIAKELAPPDHWSAAMKQRVEQRLNLIHAICCEGRTDWIAAGKGYRELADQLGVGSNLTRAQLKNSQDILLGLARCSVRIGEDAAALETLSKLQQIDHSIGSPQHKLGQMLELADCTERAEQAYKTNLAEANEESREEARLAYARFLLHSNEPNRAVEFLEESVESARQHELNFLQALLARMQNRVSDAQAILSKLHRDRPDSIAVAHQLAAVLAESEDEAMRARSLQIAESTVRNARRSADSWATLGWVRLRLGDPAAAEQEFIRSLKLQSPSKDTLYYLSELKRATGNMAESKRFHRLYTAAKGPAFFGHESTP